MASAITDYDHTEIRRPIARGPNLESPQLTIVTGTEADPRTFYIHEDLAAQHSNLVADAVRKGWEESQEHLVRLPTAAYSPVESFIRFAYSGRLYLLADSQTADIDVEWDRLRHCWSVGNMLKSMTFKDAVADAICEKIADTRKFPSPTNKTWLYTASISGSPMRQLVVDIAICCWSLDLVQNAAQQKAFNGFLKDIAVKMFEIEGKSRKAQTQFLKPGCMYHEHVKAGSACYRTMF